jgi:hypothetical protein
MRRVLVLVIATAVCAFARWFMRTANGAKGYQREPLPRSIEDYRGRGRTHLLD